MPAGEACVAEDPTNPCMQGSACDGMRAGCLTPVGTACSTDLVSDGQCSFGGECVARQLDPSDGEGGKNTLNLRIDLSKKTLVPVAIVGVLIIVVVVGMLLSKHRRQNKDLVYLRGTDPAYLEKLLTKAHYGSTGPGPYSDTRL